MSHPRYAMYLAVVPSYRAECIGRVRADLGDELSIYASDAHLDPSVRTGIAPGEYVQVKMVRLASKGFVQVGGWRRVIGAEAAIVDLNPRSLSAWLLIVARKLLRRRTLVWGHLRGRDGAASAGAGLRTFMRSLADGFIAYTYGSRREALAEIPSQQVWVAPNSLYAASKLTSRLSQTRERSDAVYVGRLEAEKKVHVAVRAFAEFVIQEPGCRLVLVGGGSQQRALQALARDLGVEDRVVFAGWINSHEDLAHVYATSFCSLSPGFIGLGLTQSLGFGVPMLASKDEPHSPEVELAITGGVTWFETDDTADCAQKMADLFADRRSLPKVEAQDYVRSHYSAEAMSAGIVHALRGTPS